MRLTAIQVVCNRQPTTVRKISASLDWSEEAAALKKLYRERTMKFGPGTTSQPLRPKELYEHFRTLRLIHCQIHILDSLLNHFANLRELCLTGNSLSELTTEQSKNLPPNLEHLVLNGSGYIFIKYTFI
jgi:Leucine-rich repeat (LRR) protein